VPPGLRSRQAASERIADASIILRPIVSRLPHCAPSPTRDGNQVMQGNPANQLFCAGLLRVGKFKRVENSAGRLSADDVMAAFDAAGESISTHQLERWRHHGLLPRAHQIGLGKGRGSTVLSDRETVAQAIEISRLYREREKRSWVGWELWLRGYPVNERYWEPAITEARRTLRKVRARARMHLASPDSIQAKEVDLLMHHLRHTPLAAPLAGVPKDMVASLIGIMAEVLLGRFVGFSAENGRPNSSERGAVIRALGANAATGHVFQGNRLNLSESIEYVLYDLSASFSGISAIGLVFEPSKNARVEFRNLILIGKSLYGLGKLKFGRSAFGLGTLSRIIDDPLVLVQASMLLVWEQMRAKGNNLLSVAEVQAMADHVAQWPK